jgi:methyl-accepting chemotaxis protein
MNSTTWTITRRITAGLGVLLLMLVLISALALVRIASLRSSVGGLADEALPSVVLLGEVAAQVQRQQLDRSLLLEALPEEAQALKADIAALEEKVVAALSRYERDFISDEESRRLYAPISEAHEAIVATRSKIDALDRDSGGDEFTQLIEQQRLITEVQDPNYTRFLTAVQAAAASSYTRGQTIAETSRAQTSVTMWLLGISSLLAVVIAGALAWITVRRISAALGGITVDLHRGDGGALERGQQDTTQRVAQRHAKATLQRLGDNRGGLRGIRTELDAKLLGLDQRIPVLLQDDAQSHG